MGLAAGAVMMVGIVGCSRPDTPAASTDQAEAQAVQVALIPVETVHLPTVIEASGSLLADETVTLSAKVAGRVLYVTHDLGDQAEQGQELAAIDPTDYRLEIQEKTLAMTQALAQLGLSAMPEGEVDTTQLPAVRRAAAQWRNARTRLDRLRQLHEQSLVSEQDYNDAQTVADIAQSEYDVAVLNAQSILASARTRQAELVSARQRLQDTRIIVPTLRIVDDAQPTDPPTYLVAQRLVSEGEYVREGTPLFRLVDDNPIRLRMAVPERHSAQIRLGQPVHVSVQAFATSFEGKVSRISPEVNPANRTFLVEAAIDNPDHRLKPGSFAMGSIEIRSDQPTILVPQTAVTTFAGVSKVFEVDNGKTREIQVRLGPTRGDDVIITQGLSAGQWIIHPLPARTVGGQSVVVAEGGPGEGALDGRAVSPSDAAQAALPAEPQG